MDVLKCTQCGSGLTIRPDNIAECQHCGAKYERKGDGHIISAIKDAVSTTQADTIYKNAQTYMALNDLKKAHSLYTELSQKYAYDYRGWLGLFGLEPFSEISALINSKNYLYAKRLAPEQNQAEIEAVFARKRKTTAGRMYDKMREELARTEVQYLDAQATTDVQEKAIKVYASYLKVAFWAILVSVVIAIVAFLTMPEQGAALQVILILLSMVAFPISLVAAAISASKRSGAKDNAKKAAQQRDKLYKECAAIARSMEMFKQHNGI